MFYGIVGFVEKDNFTEVLIKNNSAGRCFLERLGHMNQIKVNSQILYAALGLRWDNSARSAMNGGGYMIKYCQTSRRHCSPAMKRE